MNSHQRLDSVIRFFCALLLVSFVTSTVTVSMAYAGPQACGRKSAVDTVWQPIWSKLLLNEIRDANLTGRTPRRMDLLCPNYATLDKAKREKVWGQIFMMLARFESDYDPMVKYAESFENSNGNTVVSRGLFQLSSESVRYYGCDFKNECQLHNPARNIRCAVQIAKDNLAASGTLFGDCNSRGRTGRFCGLSAYWGPFRSGLKVSAIAKQIGEKIPACKTGSKELTAIRATLGKEPVASSKAAKPFNLFEALFGS